MQTIDFEKYEVNTEQRSIVFSCASDLPYQRYDEEQKTPYLEVLVIDEKSVDMSRLNGGSAVVLFNHDPEKLLGIVQRAWIVENKIFVKVRFSANDELADRVFKDILDGVIKNVSIGYQINHYTEIREAGKITRYIDDFLVYQISCVSLPADPSIGIRSKEKANMKKKSKRELEAAEQTADVSNAETETETADISNAETAEVKDIENTETAESEELERLQKENADLKLRVEELEAAQTENAETEEKDESNAEGDNPEAAEIEQIGKDFDIAEDEVKKAIQDKITVREFKQQIRTKTINIKGKNTMNTKREFAEFLKARNFDTPFMLRSFDGFGGKTGENGAPLIGTETLPLVAALEKRMGVKGFRVLSGLTSNVTIPVQTGRNTIGISELREQASNSNPGFSSRTLSPEKFAGTTRIGKELLVQANDDVVAFVVDSLTKEIAYKVQDYMLGKVATGAGNTITYSNSFEWADALAFEGYVAGYSLDTAFVMSAAQRAALKGIEKAANTAQFICDGDNRINGYDVNVSGCVSNDYIYFGDWSKLIVGMFGDGLEIVVNPYTYAKEGDVEVVASLCADAVVEQADAFVIGKQA